MPAYIPPVEFAQVEVGPEYELRDLSSLCHCCKGMASLMPDRADDLVDRIREKPEKVLSLHLLIETILIETIIPLSKKVSIVFVRRPSHAKLRIAPSVIYTLVSAFYQS